MDAMPLEVATLSLFAVMQYKIRSLCTDSGCFSLEKSWILSLRFQESGVQGFASNYMAKWKAVVLCCDCVVTVLAYGFPAEPKGHDKVTGHTFSDRQESSSPKKWILENDVFRRYHPLFGSIQV